MIPKMKPSPELDRLLKAAAGRTMTPDELFEQKVSWVYGQMMGCDPAITKEEVRRRLEANR